MVEFSAFSDESPRHNVSPCVVQNELEKLKLTLKKNGYTEQFLNSNTRPITRQREQETTEVQKQKLYFMLPFGGDLPAEILMRRISMATKSGLPDIQLRFIFGTRKLLRTNDKYSIPLMSKSLIVYLFTCACKLQYIGRSKRCLSSRIAQHLPQKLISRGASPSQKTAISEHVLDTCHQATSANFSILFKARTEKIMCAYEALTTI